MEDVKYEVLTNRTQTLEKGEQILTYQVPIDKGIKQLRLKLATSGGKIKILQIFVGKTEMDVENSWIDESNSFKELITLKNKDRKIIVRVK